MAHEGVFQGAPLLPGGTPLLPGGTRRPFPGGASPPSYGWEVYSATWLSIE
jgi:hypothetical protein